MTRYRIEFIAGPEEADHYLDILGKLPSGSTLRVENVDRSRNIRYALFLAAIVAFWGVLAVVLWSHT
jgi:hypothetical protein